MGYICPKNKFLQLKHYIQRIYLTLLSTTGVKNPYVIFETIIHVSPHNAFVFFLAQTFHTFNKNSPSKGFALKFTKFLVSFFKVSFSSKFGSLFSVLRDKSSVLFWVKLYMLLTKGAYQSANF